MINENNADKMKIVKTAHLFWVCDVEDNDNDNDNDIEDNDEDEDSEDGPPLLGL